MLRSYDGISVRQLRTRRLRSVLTGGAVALGVGMVFGVLLLSGTIRATFDDLITSAWGTTDLVVAPPNNAGTLAGGVLDQVLATDGVQRAGGMIGANLQRLDGSGKAVQGPGGTMWTAGFDPANPPYDFRYASGRPARSGREVIVERGWARDRGLGLGDSIPVLAPSGPARLRVVGIFTFSSGLSFGGAGLAGVPMGEARRLFALPEGYMSISVRVRDRGQVAAVQERLKRELGTRADVQTPAEVSDDVAQQLQALDVVLLLFGGMALFVGGFLILNSFTMTVLQRTRELGMLRTLGASRADVARSVLVEALLLAVAGTAAGLLLGLAMAEALIAMLRGLEVPVGDLAVSRSAVVVAVLAGVVATLVGAALPARRAARLSPVQAAQGGTATMRARPGIAQLGVAAVLFVPGLLFGGDYWFGDQHGGGLLWSAIGIAGTMAMFAGIVLSAPFLVPPVVSVLALPLRRLFPTAGRLAADATRTNIRRTAATAIALGIGLSVIVVNATMAQTFVRTIERQMTAGFARDLTVRPLGASLEEGGAKVVPTSVRRAIAAVPEAGVVTSVRVTLGDLPGLKNQATGLIEGVDPAAWGVVDRSPVEGAKGEDAVRALDRGSVIVGSGYAQRAHLKAGDAITLGGPRGRRRVRIAAVLQTATDFNGQVIQMSQAMLRDVYGVTQDAHLVVKARRPQDRGALEASVQRILDRNPGIESLSTAELQDSVTKQIKQQFNLFNAIVAIAVLISLLGVVNTLAMSVLERTREIGVMRALGASRWHIRGTMVAESVLVTLSGTIAGLTSGLLIAYVWARNFGDLLAGFVFSVPVTMLLLVAAAAVILGTLAAALPARRAVRMDVVRALGAE
jgi:putative ABC transport system permease protein